VPAFKGIGIKFEELAIVFYDISKCLFPSQLST
jgi:hypothetical protein